MSMNYNQQNITPYQVQNPYQQFTYTVKANGGIVTVNYAFNNIKILEASREGLLFSVQSSGGYSVIPAGLGVYYQQPYAFLSIQNPTNEDITVTFGMSMGVISDDRLVLSGVVETRQEPAETANTFKVVVGDVPTLVLTANSNRKGFLIQNGDASNLVEYLGTNSAGAYGDGQILLPAGAGNLSDNVSGEIYMIAPSGTTCDVRVVENV